MTTPPTTDSAHRRQAQRALAEALRAILPAEAVLATDETLHPYECDGLSAYRELPLAVVLPETVEQVQAIRNSVMRARSRSSRVAPAPGCQAALCRILTG